jgi:hypothetical protein
MKIIRNIFLFFLLAGIAMFSCKKDPKVSQAVNMGYNYFPTTIGSYIIYQVDSGWRDDKSSIDTVYHYLLKEVIADTIMDNSGRIAYKVARYKKYYNDTISYDSMNWVGPRMWSCIRTSSTAEKIEENVRYLKLIFPMSKGKTWNGNIFNSQAKKDYEVESLDKAEIVNNIAFDSVVTVKQFEQIDFIEYINQKEKYARNVGLIYKIRDSLNFGSYTLLHKDTIGYTYLQKIVSYGQ